VDEILASASEEGAQVEKIYLIDRHIEFCTNCRACMQQEGPGRGECSLDDDMDAILDEIECSDAIVLASPMNFGTITAVMKRFIERLTCYGFWPWGKNAPVERRKPGEKRAVLVASSAAPAFIARLTTQLVKLLKQAAGLLGARTAGVLFIGLAAREQKQQLSERTRKKARHLGKKLIAVP
jgi:NAD(P)H-dependent FMN reductase